jgi:hypothetical protein
MADNILVQVFWVACVATAIVASLLANWSRRARYIARVVRRAYALRRGTL